MSASEAKIMLDSIEHVFTAADAEPVRALEPVTMEIPEGRFISVIGPSGCGKSTLFNIIAGLEVPTGGRVIVDDTDVTGMIGIVAYMLQKDLLLQWRTILDNVILGMELQGVPVAEARKRAEPFLSRYGLGGFENKYPSELSGGMRQRAALLRTMLYDSEIMLLDEPFGALDAQTRTQMQEWLLQLWDDFGKTVLFVTHDVEEAVFLSDEIYVMAARPGRVKAVLDVPLPRPRAKHMALEPAFIAIKERCIELLSEEAQTLSAVEAA